MTVKELILELLLQDLNANVYLECSQTNEPKCVKQYQKKGLNNIVYIGDNLDEIDEYFNS